MKVTIMIKPHRCGLWKVFEQAWYLRVDYNNFLGYIWQDLYISNVPSNEAIDLYELCKAQEGRSYNVIIAVKWKQWDKEELRDYMRSIENTILW